MADKKKAFNRAIIVGEIVDKKRDVTPAYTNEETGVTSQPKPYLEFNVQAGDSRIRCRVMNSTNNPTRVNDTDRYYNEGDYIKVSGSLDYRKDKRDASKVYITVRPFTIEKVDRSKEEAKANFVIQGEVQDKESDLVEGRPVLNLKLVIVNEYNNRTYTSEYPVVAYDDMASDLFTQIEDGFEILVVGQIKQQVVRDEYDFITGNITELEVKALREIISDSAGSDDIPF